MHTVRGGGHRVRVDNVLQLEYHPLQLDALVPQHLSGLLIRLRGSRGSLAGEARLERAPPLVRREKKLGRARLLPPVFRVSLQRGYDSCCQANMAHVRQPRPDSGLGFQVKVLQRV